MNLDSNICENRGCDLERFEGASSRPHMSLPGESNRIPNPGLGITAREENEKNHPAEDSAHKSSSVGRERGVSRSPSPRPSPRCVQETDPGHGLVCSPSPLSEKSYAVCFEWTAFLFVRSIKTEGKVSQQVALLLHSDSSSLFCMKFSTMFYAVTDLNGALEVGTLFPTTE